MGATRTVVERMLRITRSYDAPRERVFRAWTDPAILQKWMAPTDEYTTRVPELDLRVGGGYRFEMEFKDGTVHTVAGAYREVKAPERLVFTWRWIGGSEAEGFPETVVTVEFRDVKGATEVTLTHELLPSREQRDKHAHGWEGCLGRLAKAL